MKEIDIKKPHKAYSQKMSCAIKMASVILSFVLCDKKTVECHFALALRMMNSYNAQRCLL